MPGVSGLHRGELWLDLFAGPGGVDEGARLAGYTGPLVGIEHDLDACRTATAAGHPRICADVATYPTAPFTGRVDGLWASPPCQSFSRAGKRAGLEDDRGQLVWQPLRWARQIRPRWVACEQVPDVLPIWQIIAAALREDGYSVWTGLLNAADFGVPQMRTRAVLIARRDGAARPPAPTHGRDASLGLFGAVQPWVTMADALGWADGDVVGFPRLADNGEQVEIDGVAYRARDLVAAGRPSATVTEKARSWERWAHLRPATTVRPGHKNREDGEAQFAEGSVRVTVAEAGVLQGFRSDYPWQGTKTSQHVQVGNAVPPPLAAAILRPLLRPAAGEVAA